MAATSAFASLHGLFHSTAFTLARNVALLLAVAFWLGLAYWVHRDARRRIRHWWLVGAATTLAIAVPYVGAVIYLLFRPPETLADIRAREIEVRALEEGLGRRPERCPVCRAEVEADFLLCPVCTTQLKQSCVRCNAALDRLWQICPYCATPVVEVATPDAVDLDAALAAEMATRSSRKAGRGATRRSA
jgi:hypothetical protein